MHHRKTYMYNYFSKIGLVDQSKLFMNLFAKFFNLQLAIRIPKNDAVSDMHCPLADIQADLRSISLLDIKIPQNNYFHKRQTDGQTCPEIYINVSQLCAVRQQ